MIMSVFVQIDAYLMRKLEEFYRLQSDLEDPDIHVKKAVSVVGLQSMKDQKKVWVLNGKVHIGEDGEIIPINESPYIWLADFLPESVLNRHGLPSNSDASAVSPYEMTSNALGNLIDALKNVFGIKELLCSPFNGRSRTSIGTLSGYL